MKKLYFIGIVFEKEISDKIKQLKVAARDKFGSSRALRSPAHITLVPPFHYEEENIMPLKKVVKSADAGRTGINLNGAGRFGKRVIFVKVDNDKALLECKKELDSKLESFGIKNRTKKFHPHVTIAFKDLREEVFADAFHYFKNKCGVGVSKNYRLVILENYKDGWKILR